MIKLVLVLSALTVGRSAQATDPPRWIPRLVQLAPTGDHFLVTLCWNRLYCRPWKFSTAERHWERIYIRDEVAEASYDSATYSKDQGTIATSRQLCPEGACDYLSSELVLIDTATGTQRTIKTSLPAFLPTIGADGQLFYWGLRSAAQQVSKGTTPYPRRIRPAVIAAHDVFVYDQRSQADTRIIEAKAQLPLAPPKLLADGRRVVVAANQIRGTVLSADRPITPWVGYNEYSTLSAILGDVRSGEMTSLEPREGPARLLLDIGCRDSFGLIGESGVLVVHNMATTGRRIVVGGKPFGPLSGLGIWKHAAFNPSCDAALAVIGVTLLWVRTNESDSADRITLPD
ncbi:hypothetical protein HLB44_25410 [Aquincola sp. S2]|uniref:Uncharacterized protein n=2 Tax=Pseudaquabacterium terrae TaxID=2732868 RepID=A0ABX2ENU1_9BURK|nr:hypothetical protein [Aquabacterium terrae]